MNQVKNKIPNINNLATTTALTAVENKIPNDIPKSLKKYRNHDKYITTQEFYKLALEHFTARLKQANLASKIDIASFVNKRDFDKLKKCYIK